MNWGVGHRCGLDLVLLWLWCNYSSNSTPSLRASICCGCGPKKAKKKKECGFKPSQGVTFLSICMMFYIYQSSCTYINKKQHFNNILLNASPCSRNICQVVMIIYFIKQLRGSNGKMDTDDNNSSFWPALTTCQILCSGLDSTCILVALYEVEAIFILLQ